MITVHRFISALQTKLSFSIQFIHVNDNLFGAFDEELKDWNGIVGMVKRDEIDTSPLALTLNSEREKVVSFTKPFEQLQ